ncbi:Amylo-alpha-1,6-glucosidase [Cardiosporidium cionae]|uniref:Amylo-alpha-1,6-glucosidase n=1 Tax=Cardiosporidium cionae TaxID=476202 RepID=A0ABQ7J5D2_9APIC|nr:Amylo-alpha-1,6-glucosidase [Cardiosporidium cionae]|eukprot:KAF8819174.1 Amylo-alpha-1,6-glucosidase [Cardiosporidium cionae]
MYASIRRIVFSRMPAFINTSKDPLVLSLAFASLQFYSFVKSSPLQWGTTLPSLSAGLPHFSTGFMRNWGRDTFIAFHGILLTTGRFLEAREEILGYARVLRHSLIPNLLDSGNTPRYNARDATWFFLQAIQDYCLLSPEGLEFLNTKVDLKYKINEESLEIITVGDIVHFILQSHITGIHFTEWNAGSSIDEHMMDEGFKISIYSDPQTGFIFGGNKYNCGTWMDKMGSSDKAGNKGLPATPRDGAAVEIIGLLKSSLRFMNSIRAKYFRDRLFQLKDASEITSMEWGSHLTQFFEEYFFIDEKDTSALIQNRCIYKDVYQSSTRADFQLRPNVCIAMAVAPELFNKQRLWGINQLGLKTLDPLDEQFCGDYDNSNNSSDRKIAHGWNYHQGPEWIWPLGYFLKAKFIFLLEEKFYSREECVKNCMEFLVNHRRFLEENLWISLPELTNADGQECFFSCKAQAWSIATILSFLHFIYIT